METVRVRDQVFTGLISSPPISPTDFKRWFGHQLSFVRVSFLQGLALIGYYIQFDPKGRSIPAFGAVAQAARHIRFQKTRCDLFARNVPVDRLSDLSRLSPDLNLHRFDLSSAGAQGTWLSRSPNPCAFFACIPNDVFAEVREGCKQTAVTENTVTPF